MNNSRLMRQVLTGWLANQPPARIVGTVASSTGAWVALPTRPHGGDAGCQATRQGRAVPVKHRLLQSLWPTRLLNSLTRDGSLLTFDALRYGMVDFIAKPGQAEENTLDRPTSRQGYLT